MKLDGEPVFSQSTLGHKTDPKPFEHNNNVLTSAMKSQNLIIMENPERLSKGTERDAVQLPYAINDADSWTAPKFDSSMSIDDLKNESQREIKDFVASHTHSSRKTEFFDKDSDIVTDKGVMECELPELTVCYKEHAYHVVKDICIDEGVPSQEKILFENGRDKKTVLIVHPPEKDQNKELLKEKEDTEIYSPEELIFLLEKDSRKNSANQFDSKDLIQIEEDPTKGILNDTTEERFLPKNELPMLERDKCASHLNCLNIDRNDVEQHPFQVPGINEILAGPALISEVEESNNSGRISMLASSTTIYAAKESNNSAVDSMLAGPTMVSSAEETNHSTGAQILASPNLVSAAEESNNSSLVNELFFYGKEERGSGRQEGFETQNTSKFENSISDAHTESRQLNQGETSFSAVGTLSSLLNYSGRIAYSGSVSLRSDSSATSTRSFAFPILQSEWNNSPVRMAKADRRHLRKHKCWRKGFLCCRF